MIPKHTLAMLRKTMLDAFASRSNASASLVNEFQRRMICGASPKSAGATRPNVYRLRLDLFRRRLMLKGRTQYPIASPLEDGL